MTDVVYVGLLVLAQLSMKNIDPDKIGTHELTLERAWVPILLGLFAILGFVDIGIDFFRGLDGTTNLRPLIKFWVAFGIPLLVPTKWLRGAS